MPPFEIAGKPWNQAERAKVAEKNGLWLEALSPALSVFLRLLRALRVPFLDIQIGTQPPNAGVPECPIPSPYHPRP